MIARNNSRKKAQEYDLWVLLIHTSNLILKALQRDSSSHSVSAAQGAILYSIKALGDKATPARISRWIVREPHSVSEILGRMERDGLIKRTKNPQRKSGVIVILTEKGQKLYEEHVNETMVFTRIMASLSDEERQLLENLLKKVRSGVLEELFKR